MKWNWGTGIALTLIVFAGLLSFAVYTALQQDFDLVSEDYYAEELAFQEVIDQRTNALRLEDKARLKVEGDQILLELPSDLEGKTKTVKTHMYYELEADYDFHIDQGKTINNRFTIDFPHFATGKWIAKVKVHCEDVDYFFEPEIVL
ncbi:MAG TPA: hypothetical protein DCG19_02960 [Cryomorphaceae bacterium]|nr:hypothetical protein [Owenweeksia sp.]MBF99745.1 hypothetical protein [Owenweeksia sp.]HAD96336.1 hypothetical protein [Cryomorphaceae bacterium]HBF22084.1 hypothetical protein [Cryomorphaceae bacterium]|tara:strand:- start:560 stop:1000 length:441 start_codon:yes stop_codon:yes gene_type:complete